MRRATRELGALAVGFVIAVEAVELRSQKVHVVRLRARAGSRLDASLTRTTGVAGDRVVSDERRVGPR